MDELVLPTTRVQWLIGNICNYNCWYCPDHLHSGDTKIYTEEQLQDGISFLCNLIRAKGRKPSIEFVGGEPTRRDSIIGGLQSSGTNQPGGHRLVTNGSADLEWFKENYIYFSEIEISYHTDWAVKNHIIEVVEFLQKIEEDKPALNIKIHCTNKDSQWQKAINVYEEFLDREYPVQLKLLYSNFTKGNQLMPYKNYQLKYYYESIGQTWDPTPTEYKDESGYIPKDRRRNDIEETKTLRHEYDRLGKLCSSGITQLIVWKNGEVYRGYCKSGGSLGSVIRKDVVLPDEPHVCDIPLCKNGFDRCNSAN
tara:strand:+ start:652 stop:1578 length:927 start_codon:yes stop_codon:yes gene_type:complete